jgi:hypothetical protein
MVAWTIPGHAWARSLVKETRRHVRDREIIAEAAEKQNPFLWGGEAVPGRLDPVSGNP